MNIFKSIIVIAILIMIGGCTDAARSALGALGEEATVTCYSGGKVIYQGVSTGKVSVADAGFTFREKQSQSYVRTNADCIITTT